MNKFIVNRVKNFKCFKIELAYIYQIPGRERPIEWKSYSSMSNVYNIEYTLPVYITLCMQEKSSVKG